jgi:hypothetical protein
MTDVPDREQQALQMLDTLNAALRPLDADVWDDGHLTLATRDKTPEPSATQQGRTMANIAAVDSPPVIVNNPPVMPTNTTPLPSPIDEPTADTPPLPNQPLNQAGLKERFKRGSEKDSRQQQRKAIAAAITRRQKLRSNVLQGMLIGMATTFFGAGIVSKFIASTEDAETEDAANHNTASPDVIGSNTAIQDSSQTDTTTIEATTQTTSIQLTAAEIHERTIGNGEGVSFVIKRVAGAEAIPAALRLPIEVGDETVPLGNIWVSAAPDALHMNPTLDSTGQVTSVTFTDHTGVPLSPEELSEYVKIKPLREQIAEARVVTRSMAAMERVEEHDPETVVTIDHAEAPTALISVIDHHPDYHDASELPTDLVTIVEWETDELPTEIIPSRAAGRRERR